VKRWALVWVFVAAPASAGAATVVVEPMRLGIERLDRVHDASTLDSRLSPQAGAGLAAALPHGLAIAADVGVASGSTDFGLLAGPRARQVRTDAALELRAPLPWRWRGWCVQGAAGAGQLRLGYHPDRVVLDTTGGAITVDLAPVHAWTRHVAAELLHSFGPNTIGVRCAWRFYALDVESPAGTRHEPARDLLASVMLRVSPF
jgi:hypothetical protein